MTSSKNFFLVLVTIFFFAACTNAEPERKKILAPDDVYRFYAISGEEGRDSVTAYFQFRRRGPNGSPIVLSEPQKISFDGQALQPDSTVERDFFYETRIPAEAATQEHTITYTDRNEQGQEEKFKFTPFRLVGELGETVSRKDLVLQVEGLTDGEKLRVVMVDTVFSSSGINEFYPVEDGRLDLRNRLNGKIHAGPVVLQLFKEVEKPLSTGAGRGQIAITYSLKREFELKD